MSLFFYKGSENILETKNNQEQIFDFGPDIPNTGRIQDAFLKVLDNKNLSFLLGSGCSSYEIENTFPVFTDQNCEINESTEDDAVDFIPAGALTEEKVLEDAEGTSEELENPQSEIPVEIKKVQLGIPIMAPMATEFYNSSDFKEKREWLKTFLKIDVESNVFKTNLEAFLSTLHSLSFYHSNVLSKDEKNKAIENISSCINSESVYSFILLNDFEKIEVIIIETRNFILKKCLNEENSKDVDRQKSIDYPLIELYKQFYRKLLTRNSTLPRLNIFTTNYDLYSERAMDLLGIHYVNGFTGGISKFFNPAIFNYALAEKMDLSQSRWSVIDNFFYLYKIHGSVNWIEEEGETKLFKVKEIQDPTFDVLKHKESIMIHPTPLKYNASLGSPYSDLFREFQKKLMQNNNILVTIGYSFSDEHINNLIFQAFTIPSFRLIVIGKPSQYNAIGKLLNLNDSRIWIIGGDDEFKTPLHYFERFVKDIMPDLTAQDLDERMESTINNLKDLLK